jgi:hypothetical protein
MQAAKNIQTPAQYLASLSPDRRVALQTIHDAIVKTAPELEPHMVYGMLGYGPFHYKYESGREGDAAVVALASQKNYISLYVMGEEQGSSLVENNRDKLGKVSVGKCCIRFKKLDDLDFKAALRLVKQASRLAAKPGGISM